MSQVLKGHIVGWEFVIVFREWRWIRNLHVRTKVTNPAGGNSHQTYLFYGSSLAHWLIRSYSTPPPPCMSRRRYRETIFEQQGSYRSTKALFLLPYPFSLASTDDGVGEREKELWKNDRQTEEGEEEQNEREKRMNDGENKLGQKSSNLPGICLSIN